jgi:hypothetical protein
MLRKACGSFALMKAGNKPGDPEVEKSYSIERVFEWLSDCPWQIKRTVIVNEGQLSHDSGSAVLPASRCLQT